MANDFLVDEDGDLLEDPITRDWIEGNSDGQHIQDILQLEPGELNYDPLIGVGITKSINGKEDGGLRKTIQMQLESDDFRILRLDLSNLENGIIDIDAERIS